MTVTVTYTIHEVPGNTVTGEWTPGAPAVTFTRTEVLTINPKVTFEQFVENRMRKGLFIKTPEGMALWIPPHRIDRIEEEPRP